MEVKPLSSSNSYNLGQSKVNDSVLKKSTEDIQERVKEKVKESEKQMNEKKVEDVSKKDLEKDIEGVNKFLEQHVTSLKFQVHEDLNRLFVEVVDQKTKEVVRQIPPKEFLDMVSAMLEHVGLIVDKKV